MLFERRLIYLRTTIVCGVGGTATFSGVVTIVWSKKDKTPHGSRWCVSLSYNPVSPIPE